MAAQADDDSQARLETHSSNKCTVAVLGEIPFAGRIVACAFAEKGMAVRVLCPDPDAESSVRNAAAGQTPPPSLEIVPGSLNSDQTVAALLEGVYGVVFVSPINLFGRMYRAAQYVNDVRRVIAAVETAAVANLVHHSAIGAQPKSPTLALRAAAEAELLVQASHCNSFCLRTGPLMGNGDGFLTRILTAANASMPFMGIMGYGSTLVQPLHVRNLAQCCARILEQKDKDEKIRPGTYTLGGPEVLTLLELTDQALVRLKRSKVKFHAPLLVLKLLAALGGSADFKERVRLLFEVFHSEQNDAEKLLGPDQRLLTPSQTQEEVLKTLQLS